MGAPKIVPGGETLEHFGWPVSSGGAKESIGQFAQFPGATPKYALNQGGRDNEFRETMARLFVQVPPSERKKFVDSCPPETRQLAAILCGSGASAGGGTGFIDFLLTSAQESFQEKYQVVESLSDNFIVYTFGQRAPTFNYSGVLLNTYQDDQRVWMLRLYHDILRGTQLARRRKLARLRYDSVIVSGIFVMHGQGLQGGDRDSAQFQFAFIPMQYTIFTPNLGKPTTLQTAFTPGSAYQLSSAAVPDTKQFRVASGKVVDPTAGPAATTTTTGPTTPATTATPTTASSTPTPTPTPTPPPTTPAPPAPTSAQEKLNGRSNEPAINPATGLPPSVFQTNPTPNPNVRGGVAIRQG